MPLQAFALLMPLPLASRRCCNTRLFCWLYTHAPKGATVAGTVTSGEFLRSQRYSGKERGKCQRILRKPSSFRKYPQKLALLRNLPNGDSISLTATKLKPLTGIPVRGFVFVKMSPRKKNLRKMALT